MKYYGGWGFVEWYNLPVTIRNWFAKRLQKQLEEEGEAYKKAAAKKS